MFCSALSESDSGRRGFDMFPQDAPHLTWPACRILGLCVFGISTCRAAEEAGKEQGILPSLEAPYKP